MHSHIISDLTSNITFRILFCKSDQYEVVPGFPGFSSHSLS